MSTKLTLHFSSSHFQSGCFIPSPKAPSFPYCITGFLLSSFSSKLIAFFLFIFLLNLIMFYNLLQSCLSFFFHSSCSLPPSTFHLFYLSLSLSPARMFLLLFCLSCSFILSFFWSFLVPIFFFGYLIFTLFSLLVFCRFHYPIFLFFSFFTHFLLFFSPFLLFSPLFPYFPTSFHRFSSHFFPPPPQQLFSFFSPNAS